MATLSFIFLAFSLLCNLSSLPLLTNAISNCGGSCTTLNDCAGQLICINGKCNDDPDVGTHICGGGSGGGGGGGGGGGNCQPSGTLNCKGKSYPQYRCSPAVSSSTQAILTLNDFSEGGDGGDPSECDERYHSNSERVVALSTGWYNKGSRCGKMIKITASNGRSTTAKVVDECDSVNGCDNAHAGQPPCRNNIVDGSQAVWDALGLNSDGDEPLKFNYDKKTGEFVTNSVIDTARAVLNGGPNSGGGVEGRLRRWMDRRLKDSFPVEVVEATPIL